MMSKSCVLQNRQAYGTEKYESIAKITIYCGFCN